MNYVRYITFDISMFRKGWQSFKKFAVSFRTLVKVFKTINFRVQVKMFFNFNPWWCFLLEVNILFYVVKSKVLLFNFMSYKTYFSGGQGGGCTPKNKENYLRYEIYYVLWTLWPYSCYLWSFQGFQNVSWKSLYYVVVTFYLKNGIKSDEKLW